MRALRATASQTVARLAVAAQGATVAAVLVACVPTAVVRAPAAPPPVLATFAVEGRLSMRHGSDALSAGFRWQHADEHDELALASPLGQTVAVLSGDASEVRLQAADGRVSSAADWSALTQQGLGWPLPVQGLSFWIQGAPRPGAPFSAETDEDGRAALIRQDGWTIVYQAYAQTADSAQRPARMVLTYPDVELRIAIDHWQ